MKKAIKSIGLLILLCGTHVIMASGASDFNVYAIDGNKFNLEVTNIIGSATSYILNPDGQILFQKQLKSEGSVKITFDISSLENGNYLFALEDDTKRQAVPFTVTDKEVIIDMNQMKKTHFPQLIQTEESLIVKLLADESNDLYIDIKDDEGHLLLKNKVKGQIGLIGKRFKFEPGDYLITISSNNYSDTKYLSIR